MAGARNGPPLVLTPSVGGATEAPDPTAGPRLDYLEYARALGGHVLHAEVGEGALGRIEAHTRRFGDWRQALRARRSDASLFLSLSEKTAMGVAALDARRPHVAITHRLTSDRRRALQRRTRWLGRLDRVIVLSTAQERYLLEEAGMDPERVRFVVHGVDQRFFAPQGGSDEGYVLSVGQSGRDYPTLIAAAARGGFPLVVAAASPWVARAADLAAESSTNVKVCPRLEYGELRDLYDRAAVVVVPLHPGMDFAAGVNGVLEGMAMRKPLVVSATEGISDYVTHDEDAVLVPPGDSGALADAVGDLLADSERGRRLAAAGRALTEGERSFEVFIEQVRRVVGEVADLSPQGRID